MKQESYEYATQIFFAVLAEHLPNSFTLAETRLLLANESISLVTMADLKKKGSVPEKLDIFDSRKMADDVKEWLDGMSFSLRDKDTVEWGKELADVAHEYAVETLGKTAAEKLRDARKKLDKKWATALKKICAAEKEILTETRHRYDQIRANCTRSAPPVVIAQNANPSTSAGAKEYREQRRKAIAAFDELFDDLKKKKVKTIKDVQPYENGTGYFDKLAYFPAKEPMLFVDKAGRRGIVVPLPIPDREKRETPHMNYVMFERYSGQEKGAIVCHSGDYRRVLPEVVDWQSVSCMKSRIEGQPASPEVRVHLRKHVVDNSVDGAHFEMALPYLKMLDLI